MEHVVVSEVAGGSWQKTLEKSAWKTSQTELFDQLPLVFGIEPHNLYTVRAYIEENLESIVEDALSGQCTKGHSCKDSRRR